jgi:hypothetical protein
LASKATLAIYDALMPAQIPQSTARGVAEALDKDMAALLATKTDLRLLGADMDRRLDHMLDQSFAARMDQRCASLEQCL